MTTKPAIITCAAFLLGAILLSATGGGDPSATINPPARFQIIPGPYDAIVGTGQDTTKLHFDSFVRLDTVTGRAWLMHYVGQNPTWFPILEVTLNTPINAPSATTSKPDTNAASR